MKKAISIHALLAESDQKHINSRADYIISIHALLAESDLFSLLRDLLHYDFYPRSPCGERRQNPGKHYVAFRFLSTLSLRRATVNPKT